MRAFLELDPKLRNSKSGYLSLTSPTTIWKCNTKLSERPFKTVLWQVCFSALFAFLHSNKTWYSSPRQLPLWWLQTVFFQSRPLYLPNASNYYPTLFTQCINIRLVFKLNESCVIESKVNSPFCSLELRKQATCDCAFCSAFMCHEMSWMPSSACLLV